jgi:hypothetical protein
MTSEAGNSTVAGVVGAGAVGATLVVKGLSKSSRKKFTLCSKRRKLWLEKLTTGQSVMSRLCTEKTIW